MTRDGRDPAACPARRRRALLAALMLPMLALAQARPLVLSIDDGPSLAATPRLDPARRHVAVLDALHRHRATAVLYVTLGFGADRPEGLAMARDWTAHGHLLGNHTVTHPDLDDERVPLQQYLDEITACDVALRDLAGWRRWFRPTYLHAGHAEQRREGLRRHLQALGYRIAGVDFDSRDWAFEARVRQRLEAPDGDPQSLKDDYLAQLRDRARLFLASPPTPRPAVLLLHHGLVSALWLDEVLALLREEGFVFVHPDEAFVE